MNQHYGQQPQHAHGQPVPPSAPPAPGLSVQVNTAGPTVIVAAPEKSHATAFLLAFLFGPLGLLYVRVTSAILWMVFSVFLIPLSLGLAWPLIWVGCMIDSLLATSAYNRKMRKQMIAAQQQMAAHQQAQLQAQQQWQAQQQQQAAWAAHQQWAAQQGNPAPQQ